MINFLKGIRLFIRSNLHNKKDIIKIVYLIVKISLMVKFLPLRYYYKRFFQNNKYSILDLQQYTKELGLIQRIIKCTPWNITCLMESLIIRNYLFKFGVVLPVAIGVKITDRIQAHAWYNELNGKGYIKILGS